MEQSSANYTTIPEFMVRRFRELGIDEGFGIVGDFALRLFDRIEGDYFTILGLPLLPLLSYLSTRGHILA